MVPLVTSPDCFKIKLLLAFATAVANTHTASAFTSKLPPLQSPTPLLRSVGKKHRQIPIGTYRIVSGAEQHVPTTHTSLSQLCTELKLIPDVLGTIPDVFGTIELSDLLYDDTSKAFEAWEWTANMGAPSALIAAAVLVTLSETRIGIAANRKDKKWIRFTKRLMRFLLLSSFAFEVVSIFVGTMMGSILLGHGSQRLARKVVGYGSPLQLLHHHHE